MPYVLIRESFFNTSVAVEGLPLNEARILGKIWMTSNKLKIAPPFQYTMTTSNKDPIEVYLFDILISGIFPFP